MPNKKFLNLILIHQNHTLIHQNSKYHYYFHKFEKFTVFSIHAPFGETKGWNIFIPPVSPAIHQRAEGTQYRVKIRVHPFVHMVVETGIKQVVFKIRGKLIPLANQIFNSLFV